MNYRWQKAETAKWTTISTKSKTDEIVSTFSNVSEPFNGRGRQCTSARRLLCHCHDVAPVRSKCITLRRSLQYVANDRSSAIASDISQPFWPPDLEVPATRCRANDRRLEENWQSCQAATDKNQTLQTAVTSMTINTSTFFVNDKAFIGLTIANRCNKLSSYMLWSLRIVILVRTIFWLSYEINAWSMLMCSTTWLQCSVFLLNIWDMLIFWQRQTKTNIPSLTNAITTNKSQANDQWSILYCSK